MREQMSGCADWGGQVRGRRAAGQVGCGAGGVWGRCGAGGTLDQSHHWAAPKMGQSLQI